MVPSDPGQESEVVAAWGETADAEVAELAVADADAELEPAAATAAEVETDPDPAGELTAEPAVEVEPLAPAALFKTMPTTPELGTPAVRVLFM